MVNLRPIGAALLVVGLICGIASTAIDYWYYMSGTVLGVSFNAYAGLWEQCRKSEQVDHAVCSTWSDYEVNTAVYTGDNLAWLHACQAMMILGVLLNAVTVFGVMWAHIKKTSARPAQATACIGGICYVIAAAIFGAKYRDVFISTQKVQMGGHLHAGLGLAIVAAIFNLVSMCLVQNGPSAGYQNV